MLGPHLYVCTMYVCMYVCMYVMLYNYRRTHYILKVKAWLNLWLRTLRIILLCTYSRGA